MTLITVIDILFVTFIPERHFIAMEIVTQEHFTHHNNAKKVERAASPRTRKQVLIAAVYKRTGC